MKKVISSLATITLAVVFVFAAVSAYGQESYQAEVSGLFSMTDNTSDMTTFGIAGEYYFQPVNTANHPYREAAFLERIGSGYATLQTIDIDNAGDGPLFGLGVRYAKPGFPYVFEGAYSRAKIDLDAGGNTTDNDILLRAGNYFTDNLLAGIEYNNADIETTGSVSSENTGFGIFAKYVGDMMGNTVGLNGSIGTGRQEGGGTTFKNVNVAVAGDYYFTRALSAGIGIGMNSGDDESIEGTTISARVDYFFTPLYSVRVGYGIFNNDNSGFEDENTLDAVIAARF